MKSSALLQADCFRIPLASKSVHCIVTSPPYWGLRKYAGEQGQEPLGLEPTPERHIERTVLWAREVWRVLRPDGVFWLNYGDCFSAAGWESNRRSVIGAGSFAPDERKSGKVPGLAAGNLMLMPHRIALALQADGWIVRQDLIWSKPNPMPESVNGWRWQRERERVGHKNTVRKSATNLGSFNEIGGNVWERDALEPDYEYGPDYELRRGSWRHTRAHEYIFMLVKGMGYWSDQEAVRESAGGWNGSSFTSHYDKAVYAGLGQAGRIEKAGRNPRSVLHIPTAPYKGSHYATYPPALITPLILATCPRWCCPVCGQGWAPVVEQQNVTSRRESAHVPGNTPTKVDSTGWKSTTGGVLGYRSACDHPHTQEEAVPGIVFDPFVGSGTTVATARELLRVGIGIDISRPYLDEQAVVRTKLGNPSNALDNLPLFNL